MGQLRKTGLIVSTPIVYIGPVSSVLGGQLRDKEAYSAALVAEEPFYYGGIVR